MTAEIISIGDEILIGQVVNTNAAYIGEKLSAIGVRVRRCSVVGDDPGDILDAFRDAWQRSDVVVVTGGLGPTHDDVTRAVVTQFFDTSLVFSPVVFEDITAMFTRLGRRLGEQHRDQAMVPASAAVMRNRHGTAPGTHFTRDGKHFFVMPGVPFEMKGMMENDVLPALAQHVDETRVAYTILTTGIPESTLADLLAGVETMLDRSALAYLPSPQGVRLRITSIDADAAEARRRADELRTFIEQRASEYIFGMEADTLEAAVGRLLRERGMTLAVAESCTGGRIGDRLTNVPGSSEYFDRGSVVYSNDSKTAMLGVDPALLERHGAVSAETARAMAAGARRAAGVDIALATTGIAGPGGGTPEKPVGLVWIAVDDARGGAALRFQFGNDRLRTKERTAQAALDLLRRRLSGLPLHSPLAHPDPLTWTEE